MQDKNDSRSDGWLRIHPDWQGFCQAHHLLDAQAFLDCRGEIVSGHVRRHVVELELGSFRGYLKKEHTILWRDRLASLWHGFGWASKSAREGKFLEKIERWEGIAPRWVAYGESSGRSFLLIEEIAGAVELREYLSRENEKRRVTFLRHLAEWVARMHDQGIDHPDLYAKHILVDTRNGQIRAIDWQRSRIYSHVPFQARCRTLASLAATLPCLIPFTVFLDEYHRASKWAIPMAEVARQVRRFTLELQTRASVKRQREVMGVEPRQRLIWLDGEAVCAIPEMRSCFTETDLKSWVYNLANNGSVRDLPGGKRVRLQVSRYPWSLSRLGSKLCGKVWRAEEMQLARRAFAEERRGVAPRKLLAFGQRETGLVQAEAFVLFEESA